MGQAEVGGGSASLDREKLRLRRRLEDVLKTELCALIFQDRERIGQEVTVCVADGHMTRLGEYGLDNEQRRYEPSKAVQERSEPDPNACV